MDANRPPPAPGGHVRPDPNDPQRPKRGLTSDDLATHDTVFRPDLLAGHRILITGGGSGMGKAAAFLAARLGAEVAICGRNPDKLAVTQEQIRAATGREIMTAAMTIRDPEACEALIAQVHDRFGGLDTVVNNAGGQFPQDAVDFSRKGWLESGTPGHVINIVANVERGMPQAAHTCAARAGVIYLSKTVATEWAPFNVRVNCIGPGVIETEGFGVYPEEALVRFHKANPMKTRGNAWDVAEAIAYLASPAGRFVNGDLMIIDGGQAQWGVVWPGGMPNYFNEGGAA
jgi:citronellol/citronellal dehydrogenase